MNDATPHIQGNHATPHTQMTDATPHTRTHAPTHTRHRSTDADRCRHSREK
ncbi:hypothetical protein [Streptomyces mirabilis]|jgi:hypothetical protein|uniref:hypothetical protein n=1 Tax=Streptomyces mirabilis TaxID=68239 RepID=UPI000A6A80E9